MLSSHHLYGLFTHLSCEVSMPWYSRGAHHVTSSYKLTILFFMSVVSTSRPNLQCPPGSRLLDIWLHYLSPDGLTVLKVSTHLPFSLTLCHSGPGNCQTPYFWRDHLLAVSTECGPRVLFPLPSDRTYFSIAVNLLLL